MVDPILIQQALNQSLLNAINSKNINAQNAATGQGATTAQSAALTAELPDILLGTPLPATVTSAVQNTAAQPGQVTLNIPQLANLIPDAEVLITTNQTQLQKGQQVEVQLPQSSNFTRLNNTLIANVNITATDINTGATQNYNGRINIVLPAEPAAKLSNQQFIQQNISNPESLVGKNFHAYFISTPDKNISVQIAQAPVSQGLSHASLASDNISGLQIKISNVALPNANNTNINIQNNTSVPILPNAASAQTQQTAPVINANVVFSGDNETILNTNVGTLRLPVNLQLPVGANLSFNIEGLDLKNLAENKRLQITNLESLKQYLASDSTALKDLLSALQANQNNPAQAAANQSAQAQIPNTTDKFIFSRAIWFLGNVSNNSPDKWLSDDSKKILSKNNLSADSANKLEGLFKTLRSFFTPAEAQPQANPNNWNNFTVPFLDSENKLNYVNFFTQQNSGNIDGEGEKTALRFVVELNNSYFGEVQIDGLLTRPDGVSTPSMHNKRLDVIFRNSNEISEDDKNELRNLFINSLEVSGLKGEISFRQVEVDYMPRPYNNADSVEINSISRNGYTI